jgi:hypothetical protein
MRGAARGALVAPWVVGALVLGGQIVSGCASGGASADWSAPAAGPMTRRAPHDDARASSELVPIVGGSFLRGEPPERATVAPFALDREEVTVDAFALCVQAGRCKASGLERSTSKKIEGTVQGECHWGREGRGERPMNCVDHARAVAYCAWLGKRLPTEVEWEWIARQFQDTSTIVLPSDGAAPRAFGERAGNVWEWSANESAIVRRIPGDDVARLITLRVGYIDGQEPSVRYVDLGFRCAR